MGIEVLPLRINEFSLTVQPMQLVEEHVSLAGSENSLILSANGTFCRPETAGWLEGFLSM